MFFPSWFTDCVSKVIVSSYQPEEQDLLPDSEFLTTEDDTRAILGIFDRPPITEGRKHDITYNGAAGRLRGSWVTIAMMESYPLELAEVRVYGSKWTLAYWYMLTMQIQEERGPSFFSTAFSRDITQKVSSSQSRPSSNHWFKFVGELQLQACMEGIPDARNAQSLRQYPVSGLENVGP